jgi:hypothetical protein
MKKIEIFEVALCCSTGVCGPSVNEDLLRITAAVNKINSSGGNAIRYNLNSNPEVYVKNATVNDLLVKEGETVLPITLLDGTVVKTKAYPSNSELAEWSSIPLESENSTSGCGCNSACCSGGSESDCCSQK